MVHICKVSNCKSTHNSENDLCEWFSIMYYVTGLLILMYSCVCSVLLLQLVEMELILPLRVFYKLICFVYKILKLSN